MYRLEIQKILLKIDQNHSDDEFVIDHLKAAISLADRNQDLHWAMELRYELIEVERSTSRCVESFSAFAWILQVCEEFPSEFNQADYLLAYHWMLCSAYSSSVMPLQKVFEIANDLENRLNQCGLSKKGFYFTMCQLYHTIRNTPKSIEFLELALEEEFDQEYKLVDQYDFRVESLAIIADFDGAITLCQEMEDLKLNAFCLPFATHCALAYYLARAKDKRSVIYLEKAKQGLLNHTGLNSSMLYSLMRLIYTMYLLEDNLLWPTYQKIASWQINAEDDLQLLLYTHMASICQKNENVKLELSSKLPFYNPSGVYATKDLSAYFLKQASDLVVAFDKRNNNDHCSKEFMSLLKDKN
ncbi:hypothetical protein ACYSNX_01355 [Myroides sp. LJL115]